MKKIIGFIDEKLDDVPAWAYPVTFLVLIAAFIGLLTYAAIVKCG